MQNNDLASVFYKLINCTPLVIIPPFCLNDCASSELNGCVITIRIKLRDIIKIRHISIVQGGGKNAPPVTDEGLMTMLKYNPSE